MHVLGLVLLPCHEEEKVSRSGIRTGVAPMQFVLIGFSAWIFQLGQRNNEHDTERILFADFNELGGHRYKGFLNIKREGYLPGPCL